jgi:GntR family transcriptional regulator, transcriptional repressor for pyruvate dehydrogenase complex
MANRGLLSPVSKAKTYSLAAEQIKALIVDGTWRPGDRLPPERELAAQLAISRGSTREALRILEAIGYIEIKPGEGAIVMDANSQQEASVDAGYLPLPAVEVGDIWEARKLVEPGAAYLAAERCNQAELQVIEDSLKQMEADAAIGEPTVVFRENPTFHLAVAKAAGNPIIAHFQQLLLETEQKAVESRPRDAESTPQRAAKVFSEHRRIFEAIKAGRPADAEKAAFDHLVNSWMAKWARTNETR